MTLKFLFLILILHFFTPPLSAQVQAELEQSRLEILQTIEVLENRASSLKQNIANLQSEISPSQTISAPREKEFSLDTTTTSEEKELKELLTNYYINSLHDHKTQDDHLTQVYVKYILENHQSHVQIDTIWSDAIMADQQSVTGEQDNKKIKELSLQFNETNEELKAYQLSYENINRALDFLLYGGRNNGSSSVSQNSTSSSSFAKEKGFHQWPLKSAQIQRRFGNTVHPEHAHITISNNGLDLSSNSDEVQAIFTGKVTKVEQNSDGLYIIIISHEGNFNSVYTELTQSFVSQNQPVTTNTLIGQASSGSNGKNMMHFELWKGAQVENPIHWLKNN